MVLELQTQLAACASISIKEVVLSFAVGKLDMINERQVA